MKLPKNCAEVVVKRRRYYVTPDLEVYYLDRDRFGNEYIERCWANGDVEKQVLRVMAQRWQRLERKRGVRRGKAT